MNKMKGANMNSYIQRSKRSICKETKSLTQKYNYPKQNIKSSFLLLMTNIWTRQSWPHSRWGGSWLCFSNMYDFRFHWKINVLKIRNLINNAYLLNSMAYHLSVFYRIFFVCFSTAGALVVVTVWGVWPIPSVCLSDSYSNVSMQGV